MILDYELGRPCMLNGIYTVSVPLPISKQMKKDRERGSSTYKKNASLDVHSAVHVLKDSPLFFDLWRPNMVKYIPQEQLHRPT